MIVIDRTVALQSIPGMRWVDPFMRWSPIIRLPLLASASFLLCLLPWILGEPLHRSFDLLVSFIMTGATLAVLVILSRGAQSDLSEAGAGHLIEELASNPRDKQLELVASITTGAIFVFYFGLIFAPGNESPLEVFTPGFYSSSTLGWIVHEWLIVISIFLSGIFVTHIFTFSYRQIGLFSRWAATLEVDLMHTEDYQIFTMQPMRYLLITVVFMSLNIIAYQILIYATTSDRVLTALIPLSLLMLAGCFAYVRPVGVVRNRIKEVKENEIASVRAALSGDRDALKAAQIADVAHEFATPDLMMYEQYVRTIWEWPIQGYLQRLLLYVLLPPLAWVLAALVERVVDGLF